MIDPAGEFDRSFPARAQADLTRMLFETRSAVIRETAWLEAPELHDALPIFWRASVEQSIRAVAERHPQIDASAEWNAGRTSFHTELRIGRILLTASQVPTPFSPVRDARFRDTLAEASQLSMLNSKKPPPKEGFLYALLLYGSNDDLRTAPAFARIQFPLPDGKYVGVGIDLFIRFPNVVRQYAPSLLRQQQPGSNPAS